MMAGDFVVAVVVVTAWLVGAFSLDAKEQKINPIAMAENTGT
jgi:hypothetical protein